MDIYAKHNPVQVVQNPGMTEPGIKKNGFALQLLSSVTT